MHAVYALGLKLKVSFFKTYWLRSMTIEDNQYNNGNDEDLNYE